MPIILPFGLSPIGLAGPQLPGAMPPPPVIAAELRDPVTFDVASMLVSADVIDDQVQIAMRARRGSGAALGSTGQRFADITKLTTNVQRLLETEARTALGLLVSRGDITIVSIGVQTDDGNAWAEVVIAYTNNRTVGKKSRRMVVPLEFSSQ